MGSLHQTSTSGASLEAMEKPQNPCAGTPETGYLPQLCAYHRLCA